MHHADTIAWNKGLNGWLIINVTMNQELIDNNSINAKSYHRYIILYLAGALLLASIAYHIYLIYTMRIQAEILQSIYPNEIFFIKYHLNFIPLYVISGMAFSIFIWWIMKKNLKSSANLIGCLILILTIGLCYVPTDKWFG